MITVIEKIVSESKKEILMTVSSKTNYLSEFKKI